MTTATAMIPGVSAQFLIWGNAVYTINTAGPEISTHVVTGDEWRKLCVSSSRFDVVAAGRSGPSDWYLVEKPRARFQREINVRREPTERGEKMLRENKQWVCKHTYHSARHPSARFSLCARSHNLFEYHLNIWWIFQQKTIKLPFQATLCARKLASPDDTKGYLVGKTKAKKHEGANLKAETNFLSKRNPQTVSPKTDKKAGCSLT